MAKYNAYALVSLASTSAVGGRPVRVFLARKHDEGDAFDDEKIRELRIDIADRNEYDLIPVDLEVVEMKDLVAQVKKALPKKRKR